MQHGSRSLTELADRLLETPEVGEQQPMGLHARTVE
jgi:hypothetical protein